MITMLETAQHRIQLDPTTQQIEYDCCGNGCTWHGVTVDVPNEKVEGTLENKKFVVEMCDGLESCETAAQDETELERMLDEYILADMKDYFVKSGGTDAEYALSIWSVANGHSSIADIVDALDGEKSEMSNRDRGVFQMKDGSIVTETDSDEFVYESLQELLKDDKEVLEEIESDKAAYEFALENELI